VELPGFVYRLYERQLRGLLAPEKLPAHIGVLVDGNRRWAKLSGQTTASGHQAGADKILEFLGWCQELDINLVTLYMLSTDNMNRSSQELDDLMGIIANTLDRLGETKTVRVKPVGNLELLPDYLAGKLRELEASTAAVTGIHVNEDPVFLEASGFVLNPDGRIETVIYTSSDLSEDRIVTTVDSTGPIGRLMPDDVLHLVRHLKSSAM
jgi:hypothetical protein